MNITTAQLGWYLVAFFAAGTVLGWIQEWLCGRYEISVSKSRGLRISRRWYGAAAQVVLRAAADDDDPDRFAVLSRCEDETTVPWLLVHRLDPEYLTYWDEDAEAFWAPVTDFAPYAVRRFRPYFYRFGRIRLPWLTKYLPLRQPAGYLQDGA